MRDGGTVKPAIGFQLARGDRDVVARVARVWVRAESASDAAAVLGVRRETLYRWLRNYEPLRVEIRRMGGATP